MVDLGGRGGGRRTYSELRLLGGELVDPGDDLVASLGGHDLVEPGLAIVC